MIGLALSGGGSRAIAFHLGCMRALHDLGILERVQVISAVSGGAVIAAMYAYGNDSFAEFEARVTALLAQGLQRAIAWKLLSPRLIPSLLATHLVSMPAAFVAECMGANPPFLRWASRTDALEAALQDIFGDVTMDEVGRSNLHVVINACELRTGTAFRFSDTVTGSQRFGAVTGHRFPVAHAVAASAAYPLLLPPFDRVYDFVQDGEHHRERVVITDGGVVDNTGISCFGPGSDRRHSLHVFDVEYMIGCNAGNSRFSDEKIPYGLPPRAMAVVESILRQSQDYTMERLQVFRQQGALKGFVLSYIGQEDTSLPCLPPNFISREHVDGYPTDFRAMSSRWIERLTQRGAQLTRLLVEANCPSLMTIA